MELNNEKNISISSDYSISLEEIEQPMRGIVDMDAKDSTPSHAG